MLAVNDEFSAARVIALQVLAQLERRRAEIADDDAEVRAEVERALAPVRQAYGEAELPVPYIERLQSELLRALPGAWQAIAQRYTRDEKRQFGIWRGGDPVARVTYVFVGLALGGLCVELPFIPIFEKWFPFVLAVLAWWLPDVQARWHRRRYAHALGNVALRMGELQPLLDGTVSTESLLLDKKREGRARAMAFGLNDSTVSEPRRPQMPLRGGEITALIGRIFSRLGLRLVKSKTAWIVFGALFLVWCAPSSFTTYVPPGMTGVKQVYFGSSAGIKDTVYWPGLHFVVAGVERLHLFPHDLQMVNFSESQSESSMHGRAARRRSRSRRRTATTCSSTSACSITSTAPIACFSTPGRGARSKIGWSFRAPIASCARRSAS